jgi:minor extracellular serine protease Vpr
MDHEVLKPRWSVAALLLVTALAAHAQTKNLRTITHHPVRVGSLVNASTDARIEVFVRLDQPSVAETNVAALERTGEFASAAEQKAQAARVTSQQQSLRSALASSGAEILSAQRVGANGFRARVRAADIQTLRSLPGVVSVGRVKLHKLDNIDSVPWIGAPAVWAAHGKGEGVKIGIIDSGIDYTHADFGGTPGTYANNDPNIIEPGTFPTAKVKGGIDLAGADYNADSDDPAQRVPHPDPDPLDVLTDDPLDVGHGTHVAGTAAGIGVPGKVGAGVAPGADLYAIKVFGDIEGSTDLTSLGIEWALDPDGDGDMKDHMDVINMSLGAPFGDPDDPSSISAENASKLGIIVVASAGNEGGDASYITGAPAVADAAISVAANSPGGRRYAKLHVNSPASLAGDQPTLEGGGGVTLQDTGPITDTLVDAEPADGCTSLTNASAVRGHIALIIRGTCNFTVKYANAAAAGARALVVYNNVPGAEPIVMAATGTTIPGVMTTFEVGSALAAATNVSVTLSAELDPKQNDKIASFSSVGPGMGGSSFKPDLAAPGLSIVSAGAGTGDDSVNLQGTSMAAPHVAGAAALLHQQHPRLPPAAIKALLQNSTVDSSSDGDTRLTRQGVGALRVDRASALSSYASPGGISFGRLNPLFQVNVDRNVTLRDISGQRRNFTVTHVPNRSYPGVQVNCPSALRVNGNGQTKFDISLKFDPRAAFAADTGDDAFQSQTEVDGWCVLSDGKDSLRVGYIAVVDPAAAVVVLPDNKLSGVTLRNFGPGFGWAEEFTLAKVGGETRGSTDASISAVGFRRGDPAIFGANVLELGVVLDKPFEHPGNLLLDFEVDNNGDGVFDFDLLAVDLSQIFADVDPGTFATVQIQGDTAFADWSVLWDYNDRVMILPFSTTDNPDEISGFVTGKFNYQLTVIDAFDNTDVQHGKVDVSKEIVPDLNSFGIEPGGKINVNQSGPNGTALWLLQNNIPLAQPAFSIHVKR